jgi:hypothetical protein
MSAAAAVSAPARALFEGMVDYAGLFPPAALGMPAAAAEYALQRAGADAWLLGRFVVPAARLGELADSAAFDGWRLSALGGADAAADAERIVSFNQIHAGRARVDVLETRAATTADVAQAMAAAPGECTVYVELPLGAELEPLLGAVQAHGARAKVRTGGVAAEAFPPPAALARFLAGCVRRNLVCKATAGLHHPVRSEQALTYAPDSPRAVMHGFLNVFVATALLLSGADVALAEDVLAEQDAHAFALDESGLAWRDVRFGAAALRATRALLTGFGSCSFREPVADLQRLGLLA